MRPIHSLLVVLFLAVVGLAAFFVMDGGEAVPEVAGAAPEQTGTPAKKGLASELVEAAGTPEDSAREGVEASAAPTTKEPLAATTTRDGEPRLAVSGRVVDEAGRPVPDATVYGLSSSGFDLMRQPLDARGVGDMRWIKRLQTRTDADGRFALEGAKPGKLRMAVRRPGFAPHDRDDLSVPAGAPLDLGTITLEPSAILSGRVVDARGAPVEGAELERLPIVKDEMFSFTPNGVPVATSGPDGGFRIDQIAAGKFELLVRSEEHPDQNHSGSTERPGETRSDLTIVLEDGYTISGQLIGAPGELAGQIQVSAGPWREEGRMVFGGPGGVETRRADAQADGTFSVRGLRKDQSYSLTARRKALGFGFGFGGSLSERVRARAGQTGVELYYQPEAAIVFQVVDGRTRQPLTEFAVSAGVDWPMPLMQEGRPVANHPEGRVRFGDLRPRKAGDRASLRVEAVGYREFSLSDIELAVGRETDLGVLALEPVPVTRVTVLDGKTGEPIAGAQVTLKEVQPEQRGFGNVQRRRSISVDVDDTGDGPMVSMDGLEEQHGRTDDDGVATLSSIPGKHCTVEAEHGSFAPAKSTPFLCSADGPTERTVLLKVGGTVVVRLQTVDGEPVAGGRVEHRSKAEADELAGFRFGGQNTAVTDKDGLATFEHLAEGLHQFRPAAEAGGGFVQAGGGAFAMITGGDDGQGEPWVEATVTDRGHVEVVVIQPEQVALFGRISEGGEPLADARLTLSRKGGHSGPRMLMPGMSGGKSVSTDGSGEYRFEGVKSGEYALTIEHSTRHMVEELEVSVGELEERVNVDLGIAMIEGRVTDEEGRPVVGARVRPEVDRQDQGGPRMRTMSVMAFQSDGADEPMITIGPGGGEQTEARTDDDGRYVLRGVRSDADLIVKADGEGLQPGSSKAVRVGENQTRHDVDITLKLGGEITVRALRADGSPGERLLVTARFEGEAKPQPEPKVQVLGRDGTAQLSGLNPGEWRVSLQSIGLGGGGSDEPIPDQVITVEAGKTAGADFTAP